MFSFSFSVSASNSVIIFPEADTYVTSTRPSDNHGGKTVLELDNGTDYPASGATWESIPYLRFDLLNISNPIQSVLLKLHTGGVSETLNIGIHLCPNISWNELTINYNNRPSYEIEPLDTTLVASSSIWYSWNVTSAVQEALGKEKISFVILAENQNPDYSVSFHSKESSSSKPYLQIEIESDETSTSKTTETSQNIITNTFWVTRTAWVTQTAWRTMTKQTADYISILFVVLMFFMFIVKRRDKGK